MINKVKLFLDFDDTITQSTKQFVKIANKKFNTNKDWQELKTWGFSDLFPDINKQDINNIFSSDEFFLDLELQEGFYETITSLKSCLDSNIATIGTKSNLNLKTKYLQTKIKDVNFKFSGIMHDGSKGYDKSSINMYNSIHIDDRIDALRSTNAKIKILYKNYKDYSWQQTNANDNVYIVNSWAEIYEILVFFIKNKKMM